ncbi:MAG: hypothetical protein ACREP9_15730 [Candidatus Dormibacteraceae bacterium]
MGPVPVEIADMPSAGDDDEEITFLDDVDGLSSTEVMLGCGNDNPY